MHQQKITFVIDSNTYSLSAGDSASIGAMPSAHREQLIALLESIQQQEQKTRETIEKLASGPLANKAINRTTADANGYNTGGEIKPERLGAGDVDALMARLAFEEQASRKPAVSKQGVYKFAAACAAAIALLVMIF